MTAEIPFRAYWSTPFARWQGALAHLHSLKFAAHTAKGALIERKINPQTFDFSVLGMTRPEQGSFYGAPWLMGLIGAGHVGGPTVSQACATSVRALSVAANAIASGEGRCALTLCCDRTSNGPHIYYPNPAGSGGTGDAEDFILANMACDPLGQHSMTQTAENVAAKHGIGSAQQHEVVLMREEQYRRACANDHAFQKRYMTLPLAVPDARFRKTQATLAGDDGVRFSSAAGLAALKPVIDGGTVTYGDQTHPADGNAAIVVAHPEQVGSLSADPAIRIRILGFGSARAALAYMPEAPIAAAQRALAAAALSIAQLHVINTHNPFAVNDLVFAQVMGWPVEAMNNYGCSLIFGHPNAPTGLRSIIELIEELVERGGGLGMFTGCAAGDTAMAVVLSVEGRPRSQ